MLSLRNLIFYDLGTTQSMIPLTKTFQTHKITFSSTLDDLALKSGIFRNINMTAASPSYLKKNHKVWKISKSTIFRIYKILMVKYFYFFFGGGARLDNLGSRVLVPYVWYERKHVTEHPQWVTKHRQGSFAMIYFPPGNFALILTTIFVFRPLTVSEPNRNLLHYRGSIFLCYHLKALQIRAPIDGTDGTTSWKLNVMSWN